MKRPTIYLILIGVVILTMGLSGCNKPAGQEVQIPTSPVVLPKATQPLPPPPPPPPPPPEATVNSAPTEGSVVHVSQPVEPPGQSKDILDQTCEKTAAKKEAPGGDIFNSLLLERPFDASFAYLPFLDITKASIYRDDNPWIYVTISLVKGPDEGKDKLPAYGVEIDNNIDGRGDVLVWAVMPQGTEWNSQGVQVWEDADEDVGATHPIFSDAPTTGNGYESLLFDQGSGKDPDAAWVRINPQVATQVQFAFKKDVLGTNQAFLWGAWADANLKDPAKFDYNDFMTMKDAGSPIRGQEYFYPIKNLWGVDNTCRGASNYASNGNELGLCAGAPPPPVVEAEPTKKPGGPTPAGPVGVPVFPMWPTTVPGPP